MIRKRAQNHVRIKQVCPVCKKKFLNSRRKKTYCSLACYYKSMRQRIGKLNPHWKGGKTEKICKICDKIFFDYDGITRRNLYCSSNCENIARSNQWQKKGNPNWIGGKPNRVCENCGKQFQSYDCQKIRFCSKNCEAGWQTTLTGEKNPAWLGGKSFEPYTSEFNAQIKELIRNRDSYKCQLCNKLEIYESGNLCVHHIDYDKYNSMPNNLITLCRSCHSKTTGNREYWQDLLMAKLENLKIFSFR